MTMIDGDDSNYFYSKIFFNFLNIFLKKALFSVGFSNSSFSGEENPRSTSFLGAPATKTIPRIRRQRICLFFVENISLNDRLLVSFV